MMKQSFIYEKGVEDKQCGMSQRNSVGSSITNKNDLLQSVLKIMQYIVLKQEKIQALKQMLTSRGDFNPQTLFSYIARDQPQIDKRHLMLLLQENQLSSSEQQIKLYFNSYGYKDKLDYGAFINLIFPVDVNLLKYISVTGIKKYSSNCQLSQATLYIYILLLKQEITSLLQLDQLKSTLLPKISRKQIKSLLRTMKKNGDCYSQMEIESQSLIKYEELKSLFKNLHNKYNKPIVSVGSARKNKKLNQAKQQKTQIYSFLEKNSVCVFRKLSMGKPNFINLQDFEFWLRPWSRLRSLSINVQECSPCFSNVFQISGIHQLGESQSHVSLGQTHMKVPISHAY